MTGKSDTQEQAVLNLYLNGIADANFADNAASSPVTNLYVSLHTADPTDSGTQSSSEVSYGNYARVAVARNPGSPAWTITNVGGVSKAVPNATINFPAGTSGSGAATHFAIGQLASGTGRIIYAGALSSSINYGSGVTPQLTTATAITED